MIEGITIQGSAGFVCRTREALELLQREGLLTAIRPYVAVIREGRRSGMEARLQQPTYTVGRATWTHSVVWYAGTIAHDSYHSKLYQEAKASCDGKEPHPSTWTGSDAEKRCLMFQRHVLDKLQADPKIVAYVKAWEENPRYAGQANGWRARWDYLRRWW